MNYIYYIFNSIKNLFKPDYTMRHEINEMNALLIRHHIIISNIVSKLPFTGEAWMQEIIREKVDKLCVKECIDKLILQNQD